ncbi:hypothetical protein [Streptomyces sp. NBC_00083]|uniref:hypothetical protein n=1 Tax=Streptomyces sp. NBC_00083 TaxID=2975647 RepID=UPI002250C9A2|nr:hypothetical protein [Streptomyces sp. NBC_00083]MCX5388369.1 hypothetical protein [Streptomyces sp. NBC_00083]
MRNKLAGLVGVLALALALGVGTVAQQGAGGSHGERQSVADSGGMAVGPLN